jgi:hypothetical protein
MLMVLSPTALRCKRARSWLRRARAVVDPADLDARFIFLWIALNSLYGQAKYRLRPDERTPEFDDIRHFADCMFRVGRGTIQRVLRVPRLQPDIQALFDDRYLDNACWRRWDEKGIVDTAARESSCVDPPTKYQNHLSTLLNRLYVLRNQVFHGCSTHRSSKNRISLEAAVPVLEHLVVVFIGMVESQGSEEPILARAPYPPSQGSRT